MFLFKIYSNLPYFWFVIIFFLLIAGLPVNYVLYKKRTNQNIRNRITFYLFTGKY